MRFEIALPGRNHIPPENDHVPHAPDWAKRLTAPDFQTIVEAVDARRYDAITTSEHLAMPYFEVPRLGGYWLDALTVMAFVAGASRRVRVGTSVLVVPYHHPLILAKAISTMDVLSGGRVDVSVGVGHAEREFQVLGVPFTERGAVTDETLDAVLELWTAERPDHRGHYFQIDGMAFEPKPIQRPRPPIYVGGNSRPALRRAARYDGWEPNPTHFDAAGIPQLLDYVWAQRGADDDRSTFDVRWVGAIPGLSRPVFGTQSPADRRAFAEQTLDCLDRLASVGVTTVLVPEPETESMSQYLEFVQWFDEEIIGHPRGDSDR